MIDELDEPFTEPFHDPEWSKMGREAALKNARHLPDNLRHAKHKQAHPECAVCAHRPA